MKFSLILATLNRPEYVKQCLESLSRQTFKDFEVIVIDQSDNNLTEKVVCNTKLPINIVYKKVVIKGLSKARNIGIKESNGEYICLIDDDARYKDNYLEVANNILNNYDKKLIICGKIFDDILNEDFIKYNCINNMEIFNDNRIFKVCLSAALIINKKDLLDIGGFDERFGIGEYFGSGEESDVIVRLIEKKYSIIYTSDMIVYHMKPKVSNDEYYFKKIYSYALGWGALFKKHMIYRKKISFAYRYIKSIIVPIIKIILYCNNRYEVKKSILNLKGHIVGFWRFKEAK